MIGQTLGHYRIESNLGEGGMGVVYRATDTRLGRAAAVKVLHPHRMADPERRRRFVQEAKAASALNHPNIITIYEIDTASTSAGPVDFIAMEYVEGRTLAEWIGRKPVRLGEALQCAVQIADALAKAHAAGIVHRDIKPANVMVTTEGLVKVLDFGLAKLTGPVEPDSEGETRTLAPNDSPRTKEGAIVGTVAYMSPEQAEGGKVGARSDVFSFGSVLYEMVSGRPPFQGRSDLSTLSAILREEPKPLTETGVGDLRKIIALCMRKDPERRFQHMADVRIALLDVKDALESGRAESTAAPRRGFPAPPVALAVVVVAAIAAAVAWWLSPRSVPAPGVVLTRLTADAGLATDPAISPDGKLVAYASDRGATSGADGNLDIWVQQVASGQAMRLTRHAADDREPAFSPDGSTVAFRSEREGGGIYVVSVLGGEEKLFARQGRRPRFSPDGRQIAYWIGNIGGSPAVPGTSKIYVVPAGPSGPGGSPRQLRAEFSAARHPIWSPDGKRILFWGIRDPQAREEEGDWWVSPLADGAPAVKTGAFDAFRRQGLERPQGSYHIIAAEWAALGDRVVFSAQSGDSVNLWELPVDGADGRVASAPQRVTSGSGLELQPAAAPGGLYVFSSLRDNIDIWALPADTSRARVTGPMRRLTDSAAPDVYPALSARGRTLTFVSKRSGNPEVWAKDMESGKETALSVIPSSEGWPSVTGGGARVAYVAAPRRELYLAPAAGGLPEKVCDDCGPPYSFSSDETKLLYWPPGAARVALLELASGRKTEILKPSAGAIYRARFSPDDRWIAFHARNRPGRSTLVVAPFRGATAVDEKEWIQVTDGESYDFSAAWSPDGNTLYFLSERHGFRCVWGQRLDPASKRPVGPPLPIQDVHGATRSMTPMTTNWLGLSASRDTLVFNFAETTGNIWMARVGRAAARGGL